MILVFASRFCVLSDIIINKILSEKEHHCNASNQTSNQSSYGPIGMGTGPLFLSWQCTDGMRQTAYEIEVTANNKTVWQSGKVQSSAMHADTPAVADSRVRGAWKIPIRYRTTTGVMIQ